MPPSAYSWQCQSRNGKTRYRGLLKHRMHAYSRCMWMNLRRMVIFQISTFQRSIFALFGPIREAFGSFMAISRKMFTSGADCYVSLRMTTLVMLDSKYALFKSGLIYKSKYCEIFTILLFCKLYRMVINPH